MSVATLFRSYNDVKNPVHLSVDELLLRIKSGESKKLIEQLRGIEDPQAQNHFKVTRLPLICFAGKFSQRNKHSLLEYSGYAIMDWDGLRAEDLRDLQTIIISEKYVYACWVSPRGGLKALVKIADPTKYTQQYDSLLEYFNAITTDYVKADPKNKDLARGCFESYDPDLWINKEAIPYPYYIENERVVIPNYGDRMELMPKILKWCSSKGQYFVEGNRNYFILCFAGACCRFGINESDCVNYCNNNFASNDSSFTRRECETTIKNAYRHWKTSFGTADFSKGQVVDVKTRMEINVAPPPELFDTSLPPKDVVYGNDVWDKASSFYDNGLPDIEGIGVPLIDNQFKLRRGELTLLSGHGNQGKSSMMKFMLLCHAALYGRKFAIFPPEDNPAEQFYNDLVEILLGADCSPRNPNRPSKDLYERAYKWVSAHFFYIYPESESPTPAYVKQRFLELIIKENVDGCIIDPWNQMDNDLSKSGGRDDQYLSVVLGDFARFATLNNVFFWIIAHPKGGSKKDATGNYPCPDVYDLAGGGMWNAKMWNILVYHRPLFYSHPEDATCELHVKKVKRREVGKRGFIEFEYKFKKRRYVFNGSDPMDGILTKLNLSGYKTQPEILLPEHIDYLPEECPF